MPLDDQVRLQHMLEWGREATEIIAGLDRTDLEADRYRYLALLRTLEVIGEAASQVSAEGRAMLPQVPWRNIVGMRNRLIHAYFNINLNIVWSTAVDDLPLLLAELERYFAAIDDGSEAERNTR
jgi:uncharacterized protein with HEPN domain